MFIYLAANKAADEFHFQGRPVSFREGGSLFMFQNRPPDMKQLFRRLPPVCALDSHSRTGQTPLGVEYQTAIEQGAH